MMGVNCELPDCDVRDMAVIRPASPTAHQILCLSKLDNMPYQRAHVKFVLLFRKAPDIEAMKSSLSAALVPYHPLAGRLKESPEDERMLVVDCTDEGALFVEAFMDATLDDLLKVESVLGSSWRKLLPRKELDKPFLSIPPLIFQVTYLRCGGLVFCMAGNHLFADGIGFAQFLGAWGELCRDPTSPLSVPPCWEREALVPKGTLNIQLPEVPGPEPNPVRDEPLVPILVTFGLDLIQQLKNGCFPKLDCTSFEIVSAHVWRCFIRAMFESRPRDKQTWIGFIANIRSCVDPPLPIGYYGNAAVSGVAQCDLGRLVSENIYLAVRALQASKAYTVSDGYVQLYMHVAADQYNNPSVVPNLLVNKWSKLGFEMVDFGSGRPVHVGGCVSDHVPLCLFLPVMDGSKDVKICVSVPKSKAHSFECYLKDLSTDGIKDPEETGAPIQTA